VSIVGAVFFRDQKEGLLESNLGDGILGSGAFSFSFPFGSCMKPAPKEIPLVRRASRVASSIPGWRSNEESTLSFCELLDLRRSAMERRESGGGEATKT